MRSDLWPPSQKSSVKVFLHVYSNQTSFNAGFHLANLISQNWSHKFTDKSSWYGAGPNTTGYISMLVTSCKYTWKQQSSVQLWEANCSFVCILPYFPWCSSVIEQKLSLSLCVRLQHIKCMRITYIVWFKHSRVCVYSRPSRRRVNENKIRFK